MELTVISWNLRHSVGAGLGELAALIAEFHPDLLVMQEATERIDGLTAEIGGDYARHPLPGRQHGLAAWSPLPFPVAPRSMILPSGLIVRRCCQILEYPEFSLANVHLSHSQFLNRRQLTAIVGTLPLRAAILGDFNLVGPASQRGFDDVGPRKTTHHAAGLWPLRLDRCLIRDLVCRDALVLSKGRSDHYPLLVRLLA